jgi:membrane complex biogenesis BtpA family protein
MEFCGTTSIIRRVQPSIGRIIGMLHVPALPGSPRNELRFSAIMDWVLNDADALVGGGVDALMLENFGDVPFYPARVPPHTIAFMTALGREVKRAFKSPLGINVLRNDAHSAIAVATAVAAEFIRVNIHTGARLTDQGIIQGAAHETLRYRDLLGSHMQIFADVDVKHSAALAPRPLELEVEDVISRGCADAVIVTGSATGKGVEEDDLKAAAKQAAGRVPVFAGSGVDATNAKAILEIADGAIVGTAFKRDSVAANPVERSRVSAFLNSLR